MAEGQAPAPTRTYRGNCHCGSFVYEVSLPEIKSVSDCNCSICTKKGYLWLFPGGLESPESLNFVKGSIEGLTNYTFGKSYLHHKFCPTCGTALVASMPTGKPNFNMGLNAHAIQGVDTWALEISSTYDGAALGDKYVEPEYSGPQPEGVEGGKVYTGSCHCGAVQVALASKPIDASFPDKIGKCNCSICERNAYIWVWPRRENVVLHGDANDIGRYKFTDKSAIAKTFCKKCGTQLTNEPILQSEEVIATLPEDRKKLYEMISPLHPVNVRVLGGVDLKEIAGKIEERRGGDRLPKYVNP